MLRKMYLGDNQEDECDTSECESTPSDDSDLIAFGSGSVSDSDMDSDMDSVSDMEDHMFSTMMNSGGITLPGPSRVQFNLPPHPQGSVATPVTVSTYEPSPIDSESLGSEDELVVQHWRKEMFLRDEFVRSTTVSFIYIYSHVYTCDIVCGTACIIIIITIELLSRFKSRMINYNIKLFCR